MDKPIDHAALEEFSVSWDLEPTGEPFLTHTSVLMPALRAGQPVMLKLTTEPDEIRGASLLQWWQGRGAVRVIERSGGAILMERAMGTRSLVQMSRDGNDEQSIGIICSVAAELHQTTPEVLPRLQLVEELFSPLIASDWDDPLVQRGRLIVTELLATSNDQRPLHGDLHHHNVLDSGAGRWVAIDPKGLFGDRTYEFACLFRNPDQAIGNDSDVFTRRLAQVEKLAETEPGRLRKWIIAFCALCLVWDYYPEGSAIFDRELAALAIESD